VPQKLLKQFAYEDLHTKSLRLFCYQKGLPPHPISPKRATAFEGYFSDPDNPAKENEIETRLNNEFENAVHCFLFEPNVEVLLPVSPLTCLPILPNVTRSRQIKEPTVREVNIAQAAFAHKHCFANIKRDQIDEIVQQESGKAEIGVKAFTVWHMDDKNAVYELLMAEPPMPRF
jgi:hypothetical protein